MIYLALEIYEDFLQIDRHPLKAFHNKKKAVEYINSLEGDRTTSYRIMEIELC